jgi:hypothetical protein
MAACDDDPVNASLERANNKTGTHAACARHADNPYIRRILKPGHTCQVCRCESSPLAQESDDIRLPVVYVFHSDPDFVYQIPAGINPAALEFPKTLQ